MYFIILVSAMDALNSASSKEPVSIPTSLFPIPDVKKKWRGILGPKMYRVCPGGLLPVEEEEDGVEKDEGVVGKE